MDDDDVRHFIFDACDDDKHPDDHWTLVPLCQAPTLVADHRNKPDPAVCGIPYGQWPHNDHGRLAKVQGTDDGQWHLFKLPTAPLVLGENAWRHNDCSGYRDRSWEQRSSEDEPVPSERCTCMCHRFPYYVNVYRLDRASGGPEEGGWWYDTGTPVASVPFDTLREAEAERDRLAERFPSTKSRYSMAATTDDFGIQIEQQFAAYWPEERPRYE